MKAPIWKLSRRTGKLTNSSGALPSPSQPAASHGPPGWALLLRLAGCRLGKQVARCLPFPFHPGQSCAWARKVKKQRTDLLFGLFRAGEAALVLPAAAATAGGMLAGRSQRLTGSTLICLPGASCIIFFLPPPPSTPSFQGVCVGGPFYYYYSNIFWGLVVPAARRK